MAVQKSKVSRANRDHRRAHDKMKKATLSADPTTGETHRRHHITEGGFYRGKHMIDIVGGSGSEED
ncbi:MAG: 50S ribosomal protein L32 [Gammaproteobacteria bacterium]|nr:50S ribosomal protein L32 [Gammaproteobacteria bacterium]